MKTSNVRTRLPRRWLSLSASRRYPPPAEEYGLATNLPLTGAWANYGVGMQNSFRLAIDQANASGALGDIKIRVIAGDDAGTATQTVSLATKAGADPTVMGAFCCWASEFGIATHSIYQRYNLPVILGGSNDHRSSRPFHSDAVVFRNSPYDLINMKFAAIYAAEIAKFKRILPNRRWIGVRPHPGR